MTDEIQNLIDETRRLDSVISDRDQHIANLERLGDALEIRCTSGGRRREWRAYRTSEKDKTDAE